MWHLREEEMATIARMDAEWQTDLERKSEVIMASMKEGFAMAFGPMFEVRDFAVIPSQKRREVVDRIRTALSQCCAITSYENRLKVLDAHNVFAVDYGRFASMKEYDTVSYIFNDEDEDNSVVVAYKMKTLNL